MNEWMNECAHGCWFDAYVFFSPLLSSLCSVLLVVFWRSKRDLLIELFFFFFTCHSVSGEGRVLTGLADSLLICVSYFFRE